MIDQTLLHYRILGKLGAGGMGVVYKARDLRLDRWVALKVLPADKVSDPERLRRFVQEAKSASALNHPNIVTIYDIGEAEGQHFIAMEYVAGKTLGQLIDRKGLPLKDALNYAVQITDALGKAHAAGIVHRDLKPANVMVTDEGLVKVLDFGLAKLVEPAEKSDGDAATMTAEGPVTEAGRIMGTVAYMSPEQAEGKPLDPRSDIFSFGTVLYEMLTGRNPFQGETSASTMAAVITREPTLPSEISGTVPAEVERAVMRCLRKEPQRRIQTMSDLKVLLQDLREESESGRASAAPTVLLAPARRKSRLWFVVALSTLVLIAVGAAAAWYWLRPTPEAPALRVERLTYESGTAMGPAISSDGKLIAYASDKAGTFDIYVRQLSSQEAIRRTQHEANDWSPCFSPDGSKIVFRSERDGGGLYVMDALGGPERKIADGGRNPSFSPDGATVLYLVGSPLVGRAKLFLVSATGGTPQPFQPEFHVPPAGGNTYSTPLWSPDGAHVLFDGMRAGDLKTRDWWLAPAAGGEAVRLAAPPRQPGASARIFTAWRGNTLYYAEGTAIAGMGLCRIPLAEKPWRIGGKPERFWELTGLLLGASVSGDGRIVFSTVELEMNIRAAALQANRGVASGQLQSVTADSIGKGNLTVAASGSKIAYFFSAPPNRGIKIRDLASGREDQVVGSDNPLLSADGSQLAYTTWSGGKMTAFVTEPGAPTARKVCERCLVQGFFSNPAEALVDYGDRVVRQDTSSGRGVTLMETSGLELMGFALSPGDRWIAFTMPSPDSTAGLYLSPVGQPPTRRDTWIQIAEDRAYLGSPSWSPDGRLLYYTSYRDGFCCAWAQRIADDGRPDGAPFAVYHRHESSLGAVILGYVEIRVTQDRLFLLLAETRGSLWSLKPNR